MKIFLVMAVMSVLLTSNVLASGEQQWNGHYYGYVNSNGISWTQANDEAMALKYYGLIGHLLTVTSQAENDAVHGFLGTWPSLAARWIGAYQEPNQNATDVGWHWVTGEPWAFTNWHFDNNPANFVGPEPNDAQTTVGVEDNEENVAFYSAVLSDSSHPWYDAPGNVSYSDGYLVEYSPVLSPEPVSSGLFLFGGSVLGFVTWRKK